MGSDDFIDIIAVHMGPFEEHAGAADDSLDVRGKLIEFFLAVVKTPGDGFVDFEPGIVLSGAIELPGFPDDVVQGTWRGWETFNVCV